MNSGSKNIDLHTKISALIKSEPLVIDALISINPHFSRLRNPILRKLLAGRVSIADACRIAGCDTSLFLTKMRELGFNPLVAEQSSLPAGESGNPGIEAGQFKAAEVLCLDVRAFLQAGEDPLKLILREAGGLKVGQSIRILNTFEPIPLISMLFKKGFLHLTERSTDTLISTWFLKTKSRIADAETTENENITESSDFDAALLKFSPGNLVELDVRSLEMPGPMLSILSELETLPAGKALFVFHKKIPIYLLPELKERGYRFFTKASPEQQVNMLIYKK